MVRRLRAIASARDLVLEELPIRARFRPRT